MIYIDSRVGSKDLLPLVRLAKVDCELTTLEFGDVWFGGHGPTGLSRFVFERKRIPDALACMQDGRLTGHQLPGMWREYEHVTLIFEGEVTRNPKSGVMMEYSPVRRRWEDRRLGNRWFMWQDWENWISIMCLVYPGLTIKYTQGPEHTARYLTATYHLLQSEWTSHGTCQILHRPNQPPEELLRQPSILRQVAAILPGIGWTRSKAVERRFQSVQDMANTDLPGWLKPKIDGVGKTTAEKAIQALRGLRMS